MTYLTERRSKYEPTEDWMVRHATDQDDADRDEAADRRFREVRDDDDQR
jgi:hypothetical protein